MSVKEKLGDAARLFNQAKEVLRENGDNAEARATQLIKDGKALMAQAESLEELEKHIQKTADMMSKAPKKQSSGFSYWGEFLKAVHGFTNGGVRDDRLKVLVEADPNEYSRESKDLSGATGSTGGVLIPPEFRETLMAVMGENAIIRPRATVIPMRRREINMPVLDQTGTTAGVPHWFGGMQFYWSDEAESKTVTTAAFRQFTLTAKKLIGYTKSSDELLDDAAISLENFLSGPMGFAGGAAWMEDYSFLRGPGGGQPLGILNSPATISQARAGGGNITYDDCVNMLSKALPNTRGVWLASQSTLAELLTMSGPSGNASYVWTGATNQSNVAVNAPPGLLLGYPIIFTEKLPALGTAGDLVWADLSYYVIGDRQQTTIQSTQFENFRADQTAWRMVHRVDGKPWLSTYLTYSDGSTTVSPFVMLAA